MVDHVVSIAETATATDIATVRADFSMTFADSVSGLDAPGGVAVMGVGLDEDGAATDAFTIGWVISIVESAAGTDVYTVQRDSPRNLIEGLTATDGTSVSSIAGNVTLVEGVLSTDSWDAIVEGTLAGGGWGEISNDTVEFYPAYENVNPVFMDLYVNDALIVGGVLMLDRVFAVRDDYLGFIGDLAIIDTQGNEDPAGVPLRLPPPDMRNSFQRSLPLSLGGKMPPEGLPNKIPSLGTRWLLTYWPVRPTATAASRAYQIVPLTDAPAQRVSVTLGGQSCRIDIYTKSFNVPAWNPGDIIT